MQFILVKWFSSYKIVCIQDEHKIQLSTLNSSRENHIIKQSGIAKIQIIHRESFTEEKMCEISLYVHCDITLHNWVMTIPDYL